MYMHCFLSEQKDLNILKKFELLLFEIEDIIQVGLVSPKHWAVSVKSMFIQRIFVKQQKLSQSAVK